MGWIAALYAFLARRELKRTRKATEEIAARLRPEEEPKSLKEVSRELLAAIAALLIIFGTFYYFAPEASMNLLNTVLGQ